jgi:hypothetical protein
VLQQIFLLPAQLAKEVSKHIACGIKPIEIHMKGNIGNLLE